MRLNDLMVVSVLVEDSGNKVYVVLVRELEIMTSGSKVVNRTGHLGKLVAKDMTTVPYDGTEQALVRFLNHTSSRGRGIR